MIKIDPCFGVREEDAEGDATLDRRLRSITECRPYFVGLIGERYGRILDPVSAELLSRYPWLKDFKNISILEIDNFAATVLATPAQRSLFYLRDPRFLLEVPHARRADFLTEDVQAAARLGMLKYRLRNSGRLLMDGYPCRWDSEAGEISGLEAFTHQVTEDLWAAISADNPPGSTDPAAATVAREVVGYSGPRKLDHQLSYTGGPGKG